MSFKHSLVSFIHFLRVKPEIVHLVHYEKAKRLTRAGNSQHAKWDLNRIEINFNGTFAG